jgi:hypothetical protein
MSDRGAGRILTFYSYKGGTGRTMALANVAWILASRGKRVLMIDWDLEAPGLHRYFAPFLADAELGETDGLMEFLAQYVVSVTKELPGEARPEETWYVVTPISSVMPSRCSGPSPKTAASIWWAPVVKMPPTAPG